MADIYGMRTGKKSTDGRTLYEFDRVYLNVKGRKVTGTIVNIYDPWYPEFKVLVDNYLWVDSNHPQYLDLHDGEATRLTKADRYFRIHRTLDDFMKYCERYDYRGMYNRAE